MNKLNYTPSWATKQLCNLGVPVKISGGVIEIFDYKFHLKNGMFVNQKTLKRNRGVKNLIDILKQEGKL